MASQKSLVFVMFFDTVRNTVLQYYSEHCSSILFGTLFFDTVRNAVLRYCSEHSSSILLGTIDYSCVRQFSQYSSPHYRFLNKAFEALLPQTIMSRLAVEPLILPILEVSHNASPVTTIDYWRNCTGGIWWPCYFRSAIWFKDDLWKASSHGF